MKTSVLFHYSLKRNKMLKTPCVIQCYYEAKDAEQQRLIGNDPRLDEAETRDVTFFHIDTTTNYREEGKFYGAVISSGHTYITNLSYDALNLHIEKHI